MGDATMQQLALELRQLRNEVSILVQRFNAIEDGLRQQAEGDGQSDAPKPPQVDAGHGTDADYQRAMDISRGIITGPPGAGGN